MKMSKSTQVVLLHKDSNYQTTQAQDTGIRTPSRMGTTFNDSRGKNRWISFLEPEESLPELILIKRSQPPHDSIPNIKHHLLPAP